MGIRVCCNFLILEIGGLKHSVNLFIIKNDNRQIQITPIHLRFFFITHYVPYCVQREENFAEKTSFFLLTCESHMTVTTMGLQEEAGSDVLSDEEVFSKMLKKAASSS